MLQEVFMKGEQKLLKEISSHSWDKSSTMSGDSHKDRLLIGGASPSNSYPLLRSFASYILADGWSTLRLASLCTFLYTTSEGGRQPCSTQYCSHRAISLALHSSSTTWSRSFHGRGSCRRPLSAGTIVGKAAWTFSNLPQFNSSLNTSNPCRLIENTSIVSIKKFVFKQSIHIIQHAAITIW